MNEFLEWALENHCVELTDDFGNHLTQDRLNKIVHEFVGVDVKELEKERCAMLDETRAASTPA